MLSTKASPIRAISQDELKRTQALSAEFRRTHRLGGIDPALATRFIGGATKLVTAPKAVRAAMRISTALRIARPSESISTLDDSEAALSFEAAEAQAQAEARRVESQQRALEQQAAEAQRLGDEQAAREADEAARRRVQEAIRFAARVKQAAEVLASSIKRAEAKMPAIAVRPRSHEMSDNKPVPGAADDPTKTVAAKHCSDAIVAAIFGADVAAALSPAQRAQVKTDAIKSIVGIRRDDRTPPHQRGLVVSSGRRFRPSHTVMSIKTGRSPVRASPAQRATQHRQRSSPALRQ
jgi:dTMP kinase